jgi:hypothetical protein
MTMLEPKILDALREADAHFQRQETSARLDVRVFDALDASEAHPSSGRSFPVGLTWGLSGALAGGLAVFFMTPLRTEGPSPSPESERLAKVLMTGQACALSEGGQRLRLEPGCQAVSMSPRMKLEALDDGWLDLTAADVRVVEGEVAFVVERPAAIEPVGVLVSAGRLEVISGRFSVREDGQRGAVQVESGTVRFVDEEGHRSEVARDESFGWSAGSGASPSERPDLSGARPGPRVVPGRKVSARSPKPASSSEAGGSRAPAQGDEVKAVEADETTAEGKTAWDDAVDAQDLERVLERVSELRALGAVHRTARLLKKVLERDLDPGTAEILSFELGEVLVELEDMPAACVHWKAYIERFPEGTYASEVDRIRSRLRCERVLSP